MLARVSLFCRRRQFYSDACNLVTHSRFRLLVRKIVDPELLGTGSDLARVVRVFRVRVLARNSGLAHEQV